MTETHGTHDVAVKTKSEGKPKSPEPRGDGPEGEPTVNPEAEGPPAQVQPDGR